MLKWLTYPRGLGVSVAKSNDPAGRVEQAQLVTLPI